MKFKKVLLCGTTLLIACAMGSAVHASANSQVQNNAQSTNVTKQLNQSSSNISNKPTDHNSFSTPNQKNNQDNLNNNRENLKPKKKQPKLIHKKIIHRYYHIRHKKRTNYYTRIKYPRHRSHGYKIFSSPYGTNANSYRPIGNQRQLADHVIHVIHEATVNHHHWVNFHSKINGWIKDNAINQNTRWLHVPLISQRPQLPSGCEITATAMMLKYRDGHRIKKMKLAREMPRSSNPNYGFVGSPYSSSGWWIKPNALMHLVNHYTHHKALNMTGDSKRSIIRQINKDIPVVIWVGYMDGFPNHALTIYGYTKHDFMYNDPWRDERRMNNKTYLWAHHADDPLVAYGALSYKK